MALLSSEKDYILAIVSDVIEEYRKKVTTVEEIEQDIDTLFDCLVRSDLTTAEYNFVDKSITRLQEIRNTLVEVTE